MYKHNKIITYCNGAAELLCVLFRTISQYSPNLRIGKLIPNQPGGTKIQLMMYIPVWDSKIVLPIEQPLLQDSCWDYGSKTHRHSWSEHTQVHITHGNITQWQSGVPMPVVFSCLCSEHRYKLLVTIYLLLEASSIMQLLNSAVPQVHYSNYISPQKWVDCYICVCIYLYQSRTLAKHIAWHSISVRLWLRRSRRTE